MIDINNIVDYAELKSALDNYHTALKEHKKTVIEESYQTAYQTYTSHQAKLETLDELDPQYAVLETLITDWKRQAEFILSENPWIHDDEIPVPNFMLSATEYEDFSNYSTQLKKELRARLVSEIQITVNEKTFNGDETSQTRMTRAIQALIDPADEIEWKLADNSIATVTKEELQQALQLALLAQKDLWFV